MKLIPLLLVCAISVIALPAAAQWQWLDKNGRKVFSDSPPPSDIPEASILRKPASRGRSADYGSAPAPEGSPLAKQTNVDKELDDKKKQAEKQTSEAETAKRKAEEEKVAKAKAENCSRARQAKAGFDSGARMSKVNEKGEREFYDDAMRTEESQRLQGIIQQDCQ
jgi:hypothetical protein